MLEQIPVSTLSWSTQNATSISLNQNLGTVSASGSKTVSPFITTTYTLTATGAGGTKTCTTTVTVIGGNEIVPPTTPITLSISPSTIAVRGSVTASAVIGTTYTPFINGSQVFANAYTIAWGDGQQTNVAQAKIMDCYYPNTSCPTSATRTHTHPYATAGTYTVTLTSAGKSVTKTVTVTGSSTSSIPTCTLTANPTSVGSGQSTTLTWTTSNAVYVGLSVATTGALPMVLPGGGQVTANGSKVFVPSHAAVVYTIQALTQAYLDYPGATPPPGSYATCSVTVNRTIAMATPPALSQINSSILSASVVLSDALLEGLFVAPLKLVVNTLGGIFYRLGIY